MDKINDLLDDFISDSDIRLYLGNEANDHIVKYQNIDDYKSLKNLLPNQTDYKIILLESELKRLNAGDVEKQTGISESFRKWMII